MSVFANFFTYKSPKNKNSNSKVSKATAFKGLKMIMLKSAFSNKPFLTSAMILESLERRRNVQGIGLDFLPNQGTFTQTTHLCKVQTLHNIGTVVAAFSEFTDNDDQVPVVDEYLVEYFAHGTDPFIITLGLVFAENGVTDTGSFETDEPDPRAAFDAKYSAGRSEIKLLQPIRPNRLTFDSGTQRYVSKMTFDITEEVNAYISKYYNSTLNQTALPTLTIDGHCQNFSTTSSSQLKGFIQSIKHTKTI